jgi:UDP-N-acetylglucosamine--N-acetylmuramyl-(pentapeptide) pyrophosphoryl-undecaprenol N-acetylglucosamine transferase
VSTRIVIAGGGTAGHVIPGLAVAEELVAGGTPRDAIVFVGAQRGIEARIVPEAGFAVRLLPGRGIQRRITWDNLGAIWGLVRAFGQMIIWVGRTRPSVVLVLGGYASVAAGLAAVIWRVPIVVAEQNARAGSANRLLGRFAKACAVPVAGVDLPRAVVTGNPIRAEVARVARRRDLPAARRRLGAGEGRRVIAVFAGSLGARSINRAVAGLVPRWADRADVYLHHVVGSRDWADRPEEAELGAGGLHYRAVEYEDDMPTVLEAADVAVCRSGGTTVAELAAVGVPAVLVPLPIAPRDHQRANAAALVDAGGAVLVDDADLDANRLAAELEALLADPARLAAMAEAARTVGRPDAAASVARLVLEHAR